MTSTEFGGKDPHNSKHEWYKTGGWDAHTCTFKSDTTGL